MGTQFNPQQLVTSNSSAKHTLQPTFHNDYSNKICDFTPTRKKSQFLCGSYQKNGPLFHHTWSYKVHKPEVFRAYFSAIMGKPT